MKKMILSILFLLLPLASSFGQMNSCDPFTLFPLEFDKLFIDTCKDSFSNEAEYCKCLSEKKDDVFSDTIRDDISLSKLKKDTFKKNEERLFNIYSNLNYEMGFQEEVFGMTPNDGDTSKDGKKTGCTAEAMAKEFRNSICKEGNGGTPCIDDIEGALSITPDAKLALDNCSKNGNCNEIYDSVNEAWLLRFVQAPDSSVISKALDYSVYSTHLVGISPSTIAATKAFCTREDMDLMVADKYAEVVDFFKKHPSLLTSVNSVGELQELLNKPLCMFMDKEIALMNQVVKEYQYKVAYSVTASKKAAAVKSLTITMLEGKFKEKDLEITKKIDDGYKTALPEACIDYNKFKVYNSAPSAELLASWAKKTPQEIEQSLQIKSPDFPEEFLKKNPTIAKNVINPENRSALAKSLHAFANAPGSQSENSKDRLISYIDFMKNDVKELNNKASNGMMDYLQCDLLAQNFAALSSNDEFPVIGLGNGGTNMEKLTNNLMACKIREESAFKAKRPSVDELVAANDLFRIFDSTPKAPDQDDEYKEFLAKFCPDFKDYTAKDLKLFCTISFDSDRCKGKAHTTGRGKRERMLNRYFKKNPAAKEAMELRDLIDDHTNKFSSQAVFAKTDSKMQNAALRKEYEEQVKPFFNRSIYSTENIFNPPSSSSSSSGGQIASNGSGVADLLNKAQEHYNTNVATSVAPVGPQMISPVASATETTESKSKPESSSSQTFGGSDPVAHHSNSTSNGSNVNPGQFIPPFLGGNLAGPQPQNTYIRDNKITSLEDAKDAIEELNMLPESEKKDLLEQAKDFLASQDQSDKQIAELQNKIDKLEEKDRTAKSAEPSHVNRSPASLNNNFQNSVNPIMGRAPVVAPAGLRETPPSALEKKEASYQKALNQVYDQSILVERDSAMEFNSTPINKNEIPGTATVGLPLEPSSDLYALISSDANEMKKYLSENLTVIPSGNIVSIKCKGPKCNKDKGEILLYITKNGNSLSIRSVAADTKVVRVYKKDDLTRELNSLKK